MPNSNALENIYSNEEPATYLHHIGTRTTPDFLLASSDIKHLEKLKRKRDVLRNTADQTGRTEDVQAWRRQSAVLRQALLQAKRTSFDKTILSNHSRRHTATEVTPKPLEKAQKATEVTLKPLEKAHNEVTLKPLEKAHYQELRLITGGIKSTPIDAMLVTGSTTIGSCHAPSYRKHYNMFPYQRKGYRKHHNMFPYQRKALILCEKLL
ncbi:unnamed protein product [Rodentolepis nana]|uniref:Uncharacterized protein n=1 Tax=Rodentolepis nana TaxID=102285 RepID=A0A0R3TV87_RODNA|nr:unnamed protein product [Rodentolepis nana]